MNCFFTKKLNKKNIFVVVLFIYLFFCLFFSGVGVGEWTRLSEFSLQRTQIEKKNFF